MNAAYANGDGIFQRLRAASPEARAEIVGELIAGHAEGKLELAGAADRRPDLRGLPLPGARLRGARLAFTDMNEASLPGAILSQAELRFAALESADLRDVDFTGADLSDAGMGEANLQNALLEDANLERASLRFANLRGAVLEGAHMAGADLWGAALDGADLRDASMRGASVGDASAAGADLSRADARETDWTNAVLDGARLAGADLRGAVLKGARLANAVLSGTRLQGLDLTACDLAHAHFEGAELDHTRLTVEQLGGAVGEEIDGQYAAAALSYLALERNFVDLGDGGAASWAYRRRRRMQKRAAGARSREALKAGDISSSAAGLAVYLGDQMVEWICDYGESLTRVFLALALVYVGFTLVYGLTGSVARITLVPAGAPPRITRNILDLAVFSLMAMTTSGGASTVSANLVGAGVPVALLSGVQALLGIFLTGLLGFVAGNRIRR